MQSPEEVAKELGLDDEMPSAHEWVRKTLMKPRCAVHGVLGYNGICGKIIVGDESICGAEAGSCEHQVTN